MRGFVSPFIFTTASQRSLVEADGLSPALAKRIYAKRVRLVRCYSHSECSLTHSLTFTLTDSLTHTHTHSHSLTDSLTFTR